ncbi:MAG: hypothetical protein ACRCZ0_12130 [Cetobacterium sp.]
MTTLKHMNEIVDSLDTIRRYEEVGYFEDVDWILIIDGNKFTRRSKINGEIGFVEYPKLGHFDSEEDFTEEQLEQFEVCIEMATSLDFYC